MPRAPHPFALNTPAALHAPLAEVRGTAGEVWLTVAPVSQPVVESKGLLGRRKQAPANWCIAVQDWSRPGAPSELTLWLQMPPGPKLTERGTPLPAGAMVEVDDTTDAMVRLPTGAEPEVAAVEVCRLAGALIAPHAPGEFFWAVGDTVTPVYDAAVRGVGG